jgi:hypothetical protein
MNEETRATGDSTQPAANGVHVEDFFRDAFNDAKEVEDGETPEAIMAVEELNQKYFAVLNYGGHFRVCCLERSTVSDGESYILVAQQPHDFAMGHVKRIVHGYRDDKPIKMEQGKLWLHSPHRRWFERVVFEPGVVPPSNIKNLWNDFAYRPVKGECGLYLAHLQDNVCRGDKDKFNWLIRWMAWHVKNPGKVAGTGVVIFGDEGVGKNMCSDPYRELWGQHGILLSDPRAVTGHFNSHFRLICCVVADEAFFAGDPRQANLLKGLFTAKTLSIEAKGLDREDVRNHLHFFILGNDKHIVRVTPDARRFTVLSCGKDQKEMHPYFAAIDTQLKGSRKVDGNYNGEGYSALLHRLLYEVDLSGFEPRKALRTPEFDEQVTLTTESCGGPEGAWLERLMSGELPGEVQDDGGMKFRMSILLKMINKGKSTREQVTTQQILKVIGKNGMDLDHNKVQNDMFLGTKNHSWLILSLKQCREIWDTVHTTKVNWPEEITAWHEVANWRFDLLGKKNENESSERNPF